MLIVILLAWLYERFGATPQANALLYGVKPVIIAIILQALWGLGRKALKSPLTLLGGLAALGLYFFGLHPIPILLGAGLAVMLFEGRAAARAWLSALFPFTLPFGLASQAGALAASQAASQAVSLAAPLAALQAAPFSVGLLFLTLLKTGAVLYGSGYVLLAFLRADFVERLGWLTESQLIDAIAIGQVTPGPVFASAAFIGFLLGGAGAALVATLGIFLPSFIFVALSNPWIPRLRSSPWTGALLDGVNAASLGLMAAVTLELGRTAFPDLLAGLVGLAAAGLLLRYNVNSTWLILGGAVIGLLRSVLL
jgi:chromate transporter